ncbi:vitamin K epoxide reductase family protein [Pseudomonas sp.]|uniref:vitamin K epoxide reductase family protein n=1 Tax=Pseudomonas sp. TaxID=306 RepID=UPI0027335515|nr:vitamin K epoxide reductase family protein [Pseudomonas sp.]MDP3813781.1 vitamin K epoxide reductase family protein [Pseudomonas sp.]
MEKRRGVAPDWPVLLLALGGMLLSGYLSFTALSDSAPLFCGQDSPCERIQQSRWSQLLGMPVSLWGFALYGVLALNAWRLPSKLPRWRRQWLVALFGLAISLYLSLIGWLELEALCAWCLLSLALLAAICARLSLKRPQSPIAVPWRPWLMRSGLTVLLALTALHLYHSDLLVPREEPQLQALAEHLQRTGAKFYGTFWCPICQEQKRLFGGSAERLPYIECTPNGSKGLLAAACIEAKITGYPTWIIRGKRYSQSLSTVELARYSRFKWRENAAP